MINHSRFIHKKLHILLRSASLVVSMVILFSWFILSLLHDSLVVVCKTLYVYRTCSATYRPIRIQHEKNPSKYRVPTEFLSEWNWSPNWGWWDYYREYAGGSSPCIQPTSTSSTQKFGSRYRRSKWWPLGSRRSQHQCYTAFMHATDACISFWHPIISYEINFIYSYD